MRSLLALFMLLTLKVWPQLAVVRDTITVRENNRTLKMPWANGINYANVSSMDLNGDGIKDLVLYDKLNQYSAGTFRCFIHTGAAGNATFRENTLLPYFFPKVLNWAVMLDYDCDGKEDIFTSSGSGVKVYRNTTLNGVISFSLVNNLLLSDYNPGGNPYMVNIYASPVAVPGIADVDNDGDLDIVSFSSQGAFIEFHRNMSKELYNNCNNLVFQMEDYCWGKISENACLVKLDDCGSKHGRPAKTYHAGSCLTCFDSDGDLDMDLLMGDISCTMIHYAHNNGSSGAAHFSDTTQLYPNYPSKGNTKTVKANYFPCGYHSDADGDGKKDLLVAPSTFGSDNFSSLWYFKNTSLTSTVNFQFQKDNFLQDEMIEVGQNSFPAIIDHNADGLKDLLIGTFGYNINGVFSAKLALYENKGTAALPSFSLITRDYAALASKNLPYVMPAVGDIDTDGDQDILIGTFNGQIHWLENTAGSGNPCNFSTFKNNPFNITTVSSVAAPFIFDLDIDGKPDIITGTKNGRLAWYRNIAATASAPSFTLADGFLGGVDVKGDVNIFSIDGYAVPFFYKENTTVNLLVGTVSGNIQHYVVPSPTSAFTQLSANVNGLNEGSQSTVCYEDINGDGKRDLFVGNAGGGLSFFTSDSPFVGMDETAQRSPPSIFPNPACSQLFIRLNGPGSLSEIRISDITGNEVLSTKAWSTSCEVNIESLAPGIYFVRIKELTSGKWQNTKLLIER
jgi:hypothetical protein